MVDCVREMATTKSCKYGKYGLFEHLVFLSVVISYIKPLSPPQGQKVTGKLKLCSHSVIKLKEATQMCVIM